MKAIGFLLLGATSQWARMEQLPGLYSLFMQGIMPPFKVLCVARGIKTREEYLATVKEGIRNRFASDGLEIPLDEDLERFFVHLVFVEDELGNIVSADSGKAEDWDNLIGETLRQKILPNGGDAIVISSLPPNVIQSSVAAFAQSMLSNDSALRWTILLEKPFGTSASTARKFYDDISNGVNWYRVILVDHYLLKYSVQNFRTLLRENWLYQAAWNSEGLQRIDIVAHEKATLEGRADTYEDMGSGVFGDMIWCHLFNLALEAALPHHLRGRDVADAAIAAEKIKLTRSVEVLEVFFGQYGKGEIDGKKVKAYRKLKPELADSTTPTFGAMKVVFKRGCIKGVPVYMQSGKALDQKSTYLGATFAPPASSSSGKTQQLRLVIYKQRGRGSARGVVQQETTVRSMGLDYHPSPIVHEMDVRQLLGGHFYLPYAKAAFDACRGHYDNFTSPELQIAIWELFGPTMDGYKKMAREKRPLVIYKPGIRFPEVSWYPEPEEDA